MKRNSFKNTLHNIMQHASLNAKLSIVQNIELAEMKYQSHLLQNILSQLYSNAIRDAVQNQKAHDIPQLVTCMDPRSEILRQYAEQLLQYETFSCAGFFDLPIYVYDCASKQKYASCPPNMQPQHTVIIKNHAQHQQTNALNERQCINASQYYMRLISIKTSQLDISDIPHAAKVQYAKTLLTKINLTQNFSSHIILCGHSANITLSDTNKYGKYLNCGACNGHNSVVNAAVMCSILNDTAVRSALTSYFINIAPDVMFFPAVHDTANNIIDVNFHYANHYFQNLKQSFDIKIEKSAREVANLNQHLASYQEAADTHTLRNAQIQHTLNTLCLNNNAAIIIANRSLSKNIDLKGEAFLHSYDHTSDDQNCSILKAIFAGPVTVAQSINAQYLVATLHILATNNHVQSSKQNLQYNEHASDADALPPEIIVNSDKVLQNIHRRLTVIVEASQAMIMHCITSSDDLQCMVRNEWIKIICCDPNAKAYIRTPQKAHYCTQQPSQSSSLFQMLQPDMTWLHIATSL